MRWIRKSPLLCEVCGNARLSGFCCESHPPIAVLIPDAVRNDTETEEPSGRAEKGREGREKVTEKLQRQYIVRDLRDKIRQDLLTDAEGVADLSPLGATILVI